MLSFIVKKLCFNVLRKLNKLSNKCWHWWAENMNQKYNFLLLGKPLEEPRDRWDEGVGGSGGGDPRFSTYEPFARGGWRHRGRECVTRVGVFSSVFFFFFPNFPSRRALLMYSLTNVSKLSFTVFYFAFLGQFFVGFLRTRGEWGRQDLGWRGFFLGGFLARNLRGGWWKTNIIGKCEENSGNSNL